MFARGHEGIRAVVVRKGEIEPIALLQAFELDVQFDRVGSLGDSREAECQQDREQEQAAGMLHGYFRVFEVFSH